MRIRSGIVLAMLTVVCMAAPAEAQWVVSPYLGANLAGDAEFRRGGPGLSVGLFGDRLGFEFDVERYNHFFKDKDVAEIVPENCGVAPRGEPCADLNTDALGFMGNLVAPFSRKGATWRPYAAAGLGVIRAWVTDPSRRLADTDQSNVAFNVGGGTLYSLNTRIALRGDVRYFRALVDEARHEGGLYRDYGFVRATVGVTFGFPRLR
jgi:opacity protein-like surface antigen